MLHRIEAYCIDLEPTSEQTTGNDKTTQRCSIFSTTMYKRPNDYRNLQKAARPCACLRINCQQISSRASVAFQPERAGCKAEKLGFFDAFPPFCFIRHETRPSSLDHQTLTPQQHTTPQFNSTTNNNAKRNGWRKRYARPHSQADAPLARAKMSRLTLSSTGKTGGKTGGKAGGDSTGKTQKSHSAKAGLQVRVAYDYLEMGRKRAGSSAGFARVDCVRAEFVRGRIARDREATLSTRVPSFFHQPPS